MKAMNLVECAQREVTVLLYISEWWKSEKKNKINVSTFERVRYWIQKAQPQITELHVSLSKIV